MKTFKSLITEINFMDRPGVKKNNKRTLHSDEDGPFNGQLFKDMSNQDHKKANKYHTDALKKLKSSDSNYDKHYKYAMGHDRFIDKSFSDWDEKKFINLLRLSPRLII